MLTWEHIKTWTRRFSFIGPRRSKKKFRIVRFVEFVITPVLGSIVNSVRPSTAKVRRTSVDSLDGGVGNRFSDAVDGCRRLVSLSILGVRMQWQD